MGSIATYSARLLALVRKSIKWSWALILSLRLWIGLVAFWNSIDCASVVKIGTASSEIGLSPTLVQVIASGLVKIVVPVESVPDYSTNA